MYRSILNITLKHYKYLFPLLIIISIHIFSTPIYAVLKADHSGSMMQMKIDRRNHLLESIGDKYDDKSHMSKTEFRLTVPFLAKILHIDTKVKIYLLQVLAGYFFFFVLVTLIFKTTQDLKITFLYAWAFSFIYVGYSFIAEVNGAFDSFSYLFILIAMLDINILFIALSLTLAFWTDERAIIAGLMVVFWGQYLQFTNNKKGFYIPSKHALAYIISVGAYVAFRIYLMSHYGFRVYIGQVGTSVLSETFRYIGVNLWQVFEGFWLIILIGVYALYQKKRYDIIFFFVAINIIQFVGAHFVLDNTRSAAYMFPSIIIATHIAKDYLDIQKLKQVTLVALFFCFMFPSMFIIAAQRPINYYSLPMHIIKKLLHT